MPALTPWTSMDVLITVKAYPTISTKYGEAVCVAGIRLDGPAPEWIRLFPVGFRDLDGSHQFEKYQVIHLNAQRHTTDTRGETWRPDLDSIEVLRKVEAGGCWPKRRALLEPLIGPTMCELNRGRKGGADAPSLGLVRAREVRGIKVRPETAWTPGQGWLRAGCACVTGDSRSVDRGSSFTPEESARRWPREAPFVDRQQEEPMLAASTTNVKFMTGPRVLLRAKRGIS